MATSSSRSRKAPWRKNRFLVRDKWITVEYYKGYEKRHLHPDDIDIMHWRGDRSDRGEHIPRGVLKIDERYVAETAFLVQVYAIQTMRKWSKRGDNERLPPYQQQRKYLKEKLCLPGPPPEYVVRREWNEEHQLHVWYVRGDIVRQYLDPHFVFGGHDLVYGTYIHASQIWIDVCQDEREIEYTLLHEIIERCLMKRGWSYNKAHAKAIKAEMAKRYAEYDVSLSFEPVHEPLAVKPIAQEGDATCGPASLKMLLDYDGIKNPDTDLPYTEAELVALCECDPELGTDHAPLVKALRKILGDDGFTHAEGGTISSLRELVIQRKRPVLVGWWNGPHRTSEEVRADNDLDEGHFSVVKDVTDQVMLANPWILDLKDDDKSGPGDETLSIRTFRRRWYDMDGSPTDADPGYRLVHGWHLYLHPPKANNGT